MKKLSLIAGLACLATVGGVFGAWVFTGQAAPVTTDAQSISISVDQDVETVGQVEATVTAGSLSIKYKQVADNGTGHAVVVGETNADFVVSFTDSTRYGEATPDYTCTATIAITGDLTNYVTPNPITADEVPSAGAYTVTFGYEAVLEQLQLDQTITASNVDTFIAAVGASSISITFTITPTTAIA